MKRPLESPVKSITKRGQFEILGVAILIVLVILGFTAYILLNRGQKEDVAGTYENEQLAQNAVDTMMRTQIGPHCVDTPGATIYELVRDLTVIKMGICVNGDIDATNESIQYATKIILGNSTGFKYNFRISLEGDSATPNREYMSIINCPRDRRVQFERTGEQRIRLLPTTETALIELELCPGS